MCLGTLSINRVPWNLGKKGNWQRDGLRGVLGSSNLWLTGQMACSLVWSLGRRGKGFKALGFLLVMLSG